MTDDTYNGLDFPMPSGLELPKGTEEGSQVDMLASFKVHEGKLCLVAVEGIPIAGEGKPQPEPEEDSFEGSVEQGL